MLVVTYRLAYGPGTVDLCPKHVKNDYTPTLGQVEHGAHEGACEVCLIREARMLCAELERWARNASTRAEAESTWATHAKLKKALNSREVDELRQFVSLRGEADDS